jgi:hypothetical protein
MLSLLAMNAQWEDSASVKRNARIPNLEPAPRPDRFSSRPHAFRHDNIDTHRLSARESLIVERRIFDNLTRTQFLGGALSPTRHREGQSFCYQAIQFAVPLRNYRHSECRDNFHVLNIVPLTTLRTIDLGGKKNSGPLFSRFCPEQRVFFEGDSAPECVHPKRDFAVTVKRISAASAARV